MSESSASEPPGTVPLEANPVLARIREARLRAHPVLDEITRLAAGAQAFRADHGASDRTRVTRTTLLWALARRDSEVLGALHAHDVGLEQLAELLRLPRAVDPLTGSFEIDADLDKALRADLSDRELEEVIGCRALAQAIVASVVERDGGLLGDRLRGLGVDPAALLETLRATPGAGPANEESSGPPGAGIPERVRDVTPERFGVALPAGSTELPTYFHRDVDEELAAALASHPPAVIVTAPAMSGALRAVYEALQRECPDEMLLLAEELVSSADGVDPERLLSSGATLVWISNLGYFAEEAPELRTWFSLRRDAVQATIVAVVREGDEDVVKQVGLTRGAVMVRMTGQLTEAEQESAQQRFGRELTTIGEVVRASRRYRSGQAAYLADSYDAYGRLSTANDALDIGRDVQMLASLVASRQVQPPLSIGLFGPWGSGKSFLMHQIKLGAVDLATRSQALGPAETSAYCPKLVTVDFNAWQYVHGVDLWASLVSRVFEGIRDQLDSTETYQKLWQDIRQRSSDVAAAQHELDAAEAELSSSSKAAELRPVAKVAADDPLLEASAAILKKTIDLDPATTQISELRTEVKGLRTVAGKFTKGWGGASPLRRFAVVALGLLGVLAVVLVSMGLTTGQDVASLLAGAVSVVTAVNALLKPARLALGAGVEILDADRRRYDDARRRRDEAAEALAAARSHGPAALYGYVSDRSVNADYRQHLGMGPMIREDLARLASLAAADDGDPTIDRIVIFIDDLDRCPAKDVVRVLEAVNLLFAHQLFVVVVAVDSRWLLESLRSEFSEVFTEGDVAAPTPQNYLEKIIQIPFWLQPVRKDAFGRLVTSLVGEVDDDAPSASETPSPTRSEENPSVGSGASEPYPSDGPHPSPFHDPAPGPTPAPVVDVEVHAPPPATVVEVDLNPAALRITARERDYLQGFHDLVTTPRATKRFLNTYQLLRAGIHDVDDYLTTEEYRPVLLLLALITGTSLVDHTMIEQLRRMQVPTLAEFLDNRAEDQAWGPVQAACADLSLDLLTPAAIEKWCTTVARYSFHPVGR